MRKRLIAITLSVFLLSGVVGWFFFSDDKPTQTIGVNSVAKTPATQVQESKINPIGGGVHPIIPPRPEPISIPAPSPYILSHEATAILDQLQEALNSHEPVLNLLDLITSSKATLSPLERSLLFTKFASFLAKAPKDISQGLIKALQTEQFADSQTMGNLVAAELLKTDPEAAAEWVETLDPFVHARQFYQTIAHDWAEKNKDDAMAWINTLQANMHNQAAAVEGLAESFGTSDLPGLIRWAEQIDDSYVRGAALLKAAKIQSLTDPAGAAKLSLGFTDPLSRRQGIQSSLTAWTNQVQDQSAPQAFVSQIQDADVKTEAQIAYVTALGAKDSKAARAYAKNLPAELQTQALQMVPSSSTLGEVP